MKFIIINADDYGICESVNQGIIECLRFGIVSDLSFMINIDEFDSSHEILKTTNINHIGIHLNFTVGKSLLGNLSKLVNNEGYYYDLKTLLTKLFFNKIKLSHIYLEIKSQFEMLISKGYVITHVDSHRNIHVLPGVMMPLLKVMKELNLDIPVRMPYEEISSLYRATKNNIMRIIILNIFTLYCFFHTKYKCNVRTIGGNLFNNSDLPEAFLDVVRRINSRSAKIYEVAVHPGYPSRKLLYYDNYCYQRLWELNYLKNAKSQIKLNSLRLTSFNDLNPNRLN